MDLAQIDLATKVWATEVTWAEGAWRYRDSQVINRPDWYQITTPSRPHVVTNGVYRSMIDDADPEPVIDAVTEHYESLGLPFRWTIGPSTRPGDLTERLTARGFKVFAQTIGMVIEASAPMPPLNPEITVEVANRETIREWARASAGGWEIPSQYLEGYTSDMAEQLEMADEQTQFLFARVGEEPAGAGILQFLHGWGWLKGTSVRPDMRRRGIYQALVARRLEIMRERGVQWAAIQAQFDTSAPICRRLGFEEVSRINMYYWEPNPKQA